MSLQYLSDADGRHTAVVIQMADWHTLTARHEDLKTLEDKPLPPETRKKPSDFFGTLSPEEGEKMQAYVKQSRDEWERAI